MLLRTNMKDFFGGFLAFRCMNCLSSFSLVIRHVVGHVASDMPSGGGIERNIYRERDRGERKSKKTGGGERERERDTYIYIYIYR